MLFDNPGVISTRRLGAGSHKLHVKVMLIAIVIQVQNPLLHTQRQVPDPGTAGVSRISVQGILGSFIPRPAAPVKRVQVISIEISPVQYDPMQVVQGLVAADLDDRAMPSGCC